MFSPTIRLISCIAEGTVFPNLLSAPPHTFEQSICKDSKGGLKELPIKASDEFYTNFRGPALVYSVWIWLFLIN